jgi:hypothetical protein
MPHRTTKFGLKGRLARRSLARVTGDVVELHAVGRRRGGARR